ncbi:hypothetical protein [Saccharothrix texasensis]|uniref:Uncharacterized protein n=1 Tax=Saccharothrix texasensis TaxID=103734 RepID=A0A3N1GX62_9PSEU|nr:hypothetical protein [Saccharothrix texasensis]ROP34845.1 hypothetical protein EDD40_0049 [Saccharothrix texasensis]
MTAPDRPIRSVAKGDRRLREQSRGKNRGLTITQQVTVTRTDGTTDGQQLRGTYGFIPNPHRNPAYNKDQPGFYAAAYEAASRDVTDAAHRYSLVQPELLEFDFADVTYRAEKWLIGQGNRGKWRVDGPEEPG